MPQTTTLTYLVGDHLGSTSLAVNASTGEVIETRYKAWGEVRWTSENKTLPTRYTFTGQYSYVSDDATDLGAAGFGLIFYNARWYDPALGRMAQADAVVPGGVQGLDRYAYVGNSPVNYVDPSGHYREGECRGGSNYSCQIRAQKMAEANRSTPSTLPDYGQYLGCGDDAECLDWALKVLGISLWEYQILARLYSTGNPDAVYGVNYILANGIRIKVGEKYQIERNQYGGWLAHGDWQSEFAVEGWYDSNSNTIYLNPNRDYEEGVMPSNWGLATIIHEAKHIEQGVFRALTKEGEMEAGQIGISVYAALEGTTPDQLPAKWMRDMYLATNVWEYQAAFCGNGHPYCTNISILPPYFILPPVLHFL